MDFIQGLVGTPLRTTPHNVLEVQDKYDALKNEFKHTVQCIIDVVDLFYSWAMQYITFVTNKLSVNISENRRPRQRDGAAVAPLTAAWLSLLRRLVSYVRTSSGPPRLELPVGVGPSRRGGTMTSGQLFRDIVAQWRRKGGAAGAVRPGCQVPRGDNGVTTHSRSLGKSWKMD
ncbi:hypothetical protein EVAR_35766_1 [Eumeta japonica]|uniref:Uncharacterized protein n=1 Tax=Eumeta variegata TaxID=151549 RepID=A0A4C1WR49_EUMVA|nr:hypothetical protein EVAR_35766_1 [Eumeta japonica]